ncbi:MAG: hypothetical protein K6A92_04575 [Lachnospiraceae bacterium]|nr:hypothetical protein [Lachnospiraceae bacterium]
MKKKFLMGIMTLAMSVLVLTACGNGGGKAASEPANTSEETGEGASFLFGTTTAKEIPAADSFAGGSGTEEDPYQIATKEQLKYLADLVNNRDKDYVSASYILLNDIEINPTDAIDSWESSAPQYNWTVIGNGQDYSEFGGHFDGRQHVIRGLYYCGNPGAVTGNSSYRVGLFGAIGDDALIENVLLEDSAFYVSGYGTTPIGGIVGEISTLGNAQVRTCSSYAKIVTESGIVGGIVGQAASGSTVQYCSNYGPVEIRTGSTGTAGGVIGSFAGYQVSGCENRGAVTGNGSANIGGVIGSLSPAASTLVIGEDAMNKYGENISSLTCLISDLQNLGTVTRTEDASSIVSCGGVIGELTDNGITLTVSGLINEGAVSCTDQYAGGVVGTVMVQSMAERTTTTTLSALENYGDLTSTNENNNLGGITGYINVSEGQEVILENSLNAGAMSGSVGGLVHTAVLTQSGVLTIRGCENRAAVSSNKIAASLGGICSFLTCSKPEEGVNTITIENCVNTGAIDGENSIANGGIVGITSLMNNAGSSVVVKGCENSGEISFYYREDYAANHAPIFAAGIVGWFDTDVEGTYELSGNSNTGNVILKGEIPDKDTLSKEIGYFQNAAITAKTGDNTILSGNAVQGDLLIPSLGDFSAPLKEAGIVLPPDVPEEASN